MLGIQNNTFSTYRERRIKTNVQTFPKEGVSSLSFCFPLYFKCKHIFLIILTISGAHMQVYTSLLITREQRFLIDTVLCVFIKYQLVSVQTVNCILCCGKSLNPSYLLICHVLVILPIFSLHDLNVIMLFYCLYFFWDSLI